MKDVCVIGGSRYFGKLLIQQLLDDGCRVTVINRGSSAPPAGVAHVIADRNDEAALTAALGERGFDVLIDQVCYTPWQAAIATRVFAARTKRYVMTSTIEVYNPDGSDAIGPHTEALAEDAVDLADWPVRMDFPWDGADFLEAHYGEGKRQAEAVFTREALFSFVSVRVGHVLGGGAEDFTGRLDHYVRRIRDGRPVTVVRDSQPSSFIGHEETARFLQWTAAANFTGPVNACSNGELDAARLSREIAARYGSRPVFAVADDASPYSFSHYYGMDNTRARHLGFSFSETSDWLPAAIAEAVAAAH